MRSPFRAAVLAACCLAFESPAKPLAIDLTTAPPAATASPYGPGTMKNPRGGTITADSRSFFFNGEPWMPILGEFHYARYPRDEWRDELLKMKAGGIDTVSTYVFWNHHEEERGKFDWSGQRSLRDFLKLCQQLGLHAFVRLGPWCHGEARNGAFPDWVQHSSTKLRTPDPAFLKLVEPFYKEEFEQMKGLLWKDGGPVIGVQIDNENGNAAYLLKLKEMARDAGIDVPFYAITGWQGGLPKDSLIPLFGGYVDGFWGGSIEQYRREYIFSDVRAVNDLGTRLESINPANGKLVAQFPYACVEIGGGMMSSYKKRIKLDPNDIASLALTKLGGGNTMPGYYMYHGGTNPDGKLSTLQEEHPNQMPVKDYDFATALGSAGQVREQYHLLREQHTFLRDFGPQLARMPAYFPEERPSSLKDFETLRWSVRWNGKSGFLFFNNKQPREPLPPHGGVQFALETPAGTQLVPNRPITIPSGSYGILPINLDCSGVSLKYATAQPLCRLADGGGNVVYFFTELPGIPPELVFDPAGGRVVLMAGSVENVGPAMRVYGFRTGTSSPVVVTKRDGGRVLFVVLTAGQGQELWRCTIDGSERIILSRATPLVDDGGIRMQADAADAVTFAIFPELPEVKIEGQSLTAIPDGIFTRFEAAGPLDAPLPVKATLEKAASPRAAKLTGADEAAWTYAAIYRLEIPAAYAGRQVILNLAYIGDAARLYLGDKLLNDQFYNGDAFAIPLWRVPADQWNQLRFKMLPFPEDQQVRLPEAVKVKGAAAKIAVTPEQIPVTVSEERELQVNF